VASTKEAEARERIVGAAMRCVGRYEPGKTSLSDVAHELGVTWRTVYRYFAGTQRVAQSLVLDPGTPPRSGSALRDFLRRLVGPAIVCHAAGRMRPGGHLRHPTPAPAATAGDGRPCPFCA
jgi:AcrR family transcriptional regulator